MADSQLDIDGCGIYLSYDSKVTETGNAAIAVSAISSPPSSSAPQHATIAIAAEHVQYRFPWGKHKGELLSKIPNEYVEWLQKCSDAYKNSKSMQNAVEAHLYTNTAKAIPSAHVPPPHRQRSLKRSATTVMPPPPAKQARTFSRTVSAPDMLNSHMCPRAGQPRQLPTPQVSFSSQAASSSQPEAAVNLQAEVKAEALEYRLTFGAHIGKSFAELPVAYIDWLKTTPEYETDDDLAIAIGEWEDLHPPVLVPVAVLSTAHRIAPAPTSSSQPATRPALAEKSDYIPQPSEPYRLPFGKYTGKTLDEVPADYIAWLTNADRADDALKAAIAHWDAKPRGYFLTFGKHKGSTLAQVPQTYIDWLHEDGVAKDHPDLKKALRWYPKTKKEAARKPRVLSGPQRRVLYGGRRASGWY